MKKLSSLSIRAKLTLIVMTTTFVALITALIAMGVFDQINTRGRLRRDATTRALIVADNCTAALSFGDPRPAQNALMALSADPHLGAGAVYDEHGKTLARQISHGWEVPLPKKPGGSSVQFGDNYLEVTQPVMLHGRQIGTVVLQTDLAELDDRMMQGGTTSALISIAALTIGYLLATRLQRLISRPILQLAETSRAVAAGKNYSIRVPRESGDELGQLVDGYNEMLSQIESRDTALQQAHAQLEKRVGERTRDLFESNARLHEQVKAAQQAREESAGLAKQLQGAFDKLQSESSERADLEIQLRQAQKMDAIGQLAAGVAHDFNNLLTVIQGHTQIVMAMQTEEGMAKEALSRVVGAVQRAAQLTGQLLTFSRKQVAIPRPIDLNSVVSNCTAMLKPLLGENVRLQLHPAPSLPQIEGDAGMLEQVIVNLAVNARDAMPRGGDLILGTFVTEIDASYLQCRPQARPGTFVCLQVSDSGCGMDAPTLERIFEPFFTTKGVGKGTGLGLATAYGIVKQHRGWIEVISQAGVGTTFKIFMPALAVVSGSTDTTIVTDKVRGGSETILLVEDEPALRDLVSTILRTYGYKVIEAGHGKEALGLWKNCDRKPDLLLTDMMMPEGMTGWELAQQLGQDTEGLKVVYTSGYSPELFNGQVQLNGSANFLPKPFHPRVLATTVRQCLDN